MRRVLPVEDRAAGHLACLMVVVAALLGCVLPQAASAEEPSPSAEAETYSVCPAKPGVYECLVQAEPLALTLAGIRPEDSPALEGGGELKGLDPENLREAYKLPKTGGSGQTIAIVDAYNDPNAEADLQKYREQYKVYFKGTETACTEANGCFKKLNQTGEAKNYPANSSSWSVEISLDLDMASAVCPECHIDLVEASKEGNELDVAEQEAASLKPAVISNSWGRAEESAQTARNVYFDHPGIPVVAAAGDSGYAVEYPAASPDVIAAGGTTLKKAENARGWSETVWSGSGGGCSKYEGKPPWQTDKGCAKRTDNDVAADASGESPVSVYDSYEYPGWENVWGTSAATPIVSGIEAQASSATRALAADAFYKKPGMLFHVSEGSNGSCGTEASETYYLCHATKEGYNGPTGEGTPDKGFESIAAAAATSLATKIKGTEATLTGLVNPNGLATKYYFEYGATTAYGKKTEEVSAGSGTSNLEESKVITGLTESTTYHFRIVATNSNGTTDGLDEVFTTLAAKLPKVETKAASGVTKIEATLNGAVNPEGLEAKYYFEYGTTESYGTKTAEASAGSGTSYVEESKAVVGLFEGTKYYFRIVATNSNGTTYGASQTFKTIEGTANELASMAITEPFNGSTSSLEDYEKNWSTLGWASEEGNDTETGWRPNKSYPAVNGDFDTATVAEAGSGIAVVATMTKEPADSERYFSLWLDASGSSSTRSGYELRFTALSETTYNLTLSKWVTGTQTNLTSKSSYAFAIGDSLALVDQGSTVSVWTNLGTAFSELLSASDATFEHGNAGLEGAGNRTHLDNFKEGVL
jgi:hypothetical protein